LSADELVATFPKYIAYNLPTGQHDYVALIKGDPNKISLNLIHERMGKYIAPLNHSMRKYGISLSRKGRPISLDKYLWKLGDGFI